MKTQTHKKRIEKRAGQLQDELNLAIIDGHFSKPHIQINNLQCAIHDVICDLERQIIVKRKDEP